MKRRKFSWRRLWHSIPPLARAYILSFGCWGIVACSLGAEAAVRTQDVWLGAVQPGLREWLPWAVLTPLIFVLAHRLPIERQRWKVSLPVHILCAITAVLMCQWWKASVDRMVRVDPMLPPETWGLVMTGMPPATALASTMPPPQQAPGLWRRLLGPWAISFGMLHLATVEIPIYLMLLSAAHTLTFYRRTQDRESSLAVARAEAQKMQLQPHFLFNTLNMIAELVYEEPEKADAMLTALSGLLRLTMETAGEQELPLRRELEFIERYLTIMHARFEDRLKFQFGIDPATHAAMVPTFLLQPLVENAIEHGLGPRTSGGLISIRARRVGDVLHLCVADNGVGLNGKKAGPEGIGLGNTRNRLRELYGEAGVLDMQDLNGLIVEIRLPFHLE